MAKKVETENALRFFLLFRRLHFCVLDSSISFISVVGLKRVSKL
jgi:hypothetical protein